MNTAGPFSKEEFLTGLERFRALLGKKSFWARPEVNRQAAVNAIGIMYLNLAPSIEGKVLDTLQVRFASALDEYTRRDIICLIAGLAGKE